MLFAKTRDVSDKIILIYLSKMNEIKNIVVILNTFH